MKLSPRFSVRAMVILLTLVCLYFGSWSLTDRFGVPNVTSQYEGFQSAHSPAALVVYVDSHESIPHAGAVFESRGVRHWHLWVFGVSIELPYKTHRPGATFLLHD